VEFKGLDNWEEVKNIFLERMALAGKQVLGGGKSSTRPL